jgi:hypothetical protein
MTNEEILRQHDPGFLKGRRWERRLIVALALFTALAFGGAAVAVVGTFKNETRITNVERSACAQDPDGEDCQRIKRESDRQRSVADSCIAFEKVDRDGRLLRLTRCRVGPSEVQANSKEVQNLDKGDGVDLTTNSPGNGPGQLPAGHSHPAPQEHGHGTAPTPPQHGGSPAPTGSAMAAPGGEPAAVEADQGTGSTGSSAGEAETARPNPITESVGGILEETGEAVNGVLCGATGSLQLQHNC